VNGGALSSGRRWQLCYPLWRVDKGSLSCKIGGKRTVRLRAVFERRESTNGGWSRWLIGGECQRQALLGVEEKGRKKRVSHWSRPFYRRRGWSGWRRATRIGICGHRLARPVELAAGTPSGTETLPRLADEWARDQFKRFQVGNVSMGCTIHSGPAQ
jgi:hypothetical protein